MKIQIVEFNKETDKMVIEFENIPEGSHETIESFFGNKENKKTILLVGEGTFNVTIFKNFPSKQGKNN